MAHFSIPQFPKSEVISSLAKLSEKLLRHLDSSADLDHEVAALDWRLHSLQKFKAAHGTVDKMLYDGCKNFEGLGCVIPAVPEVKVAHSPNLPSAFSPKKISSCCELSLLIPCPLARSSLDIYLE